MKAPKQKDQKFRMTINEFFKDVFEAVEDNNANTNKNKIRFFTTYNKEVFLLSIYTDDDDNICIDLSKE